MTKPFISFTACLGTVVSLSLILATGVAGATASGDRGVWTHSGAQLSGNQFDADLDSRGRIVILGSETLELLPDGSVHSSDSYGDLQQFSMDMPPALSIDPDGGLHTLIRTGEAGGYDAGFPIQYRFRSADGEWGAPIPMGKPMKRNYCVGVVGINGALAYAVVSEGLGNVWGPVHFYRIEAGSVTKEGVFNDVWRSDNRVTFIRSGEWVYLATGMNDPNGAAFLFSAQIGDNLFQRLLVSQTKFMPAAMNESRRGFPTLTAATPDAVDFTMGAQDGRLYWGKSSPKQPLKESDLRLVFDDLGAWHLSIGRGAAGSSDDGQLVLVAGLRSEGGKLGAGDLVAKVSYDGGATFGEEQTIYSGVEGGEGRTRIRVIPHGRNFFVLYATATDVHLSHFDSDAESTPEN